MASTLRVRAVTWLTVYFSLYIRKNMRGKEEGRTKINIFCTQKSCKQEKNMSIFASFTKLGKYCNYKDNYTTKNKNGNKNVEFNP